MDCIGPEVLVKPTESVLSQNIENIINAEFSTAHLPKR